MTLLDINNLAEKTIWGTADEVLNAYVEIRLDKDSIEEDTWKAKLTKLVYSKVHIVKFINGAYSVCICDWHKLFHDNLDLWKEYTKKHWRKDDLELWDDEDEMDEAVYQLIEQLGKSLKNKKSDSILEEWYNTILQCK